MSFKSDLLTWVEEASQEEYGHTPDGLDILFDILDHFAIGGTITNFRDFTRQEVMAVLSVAWVDVRRSVYSRIMRDGEDGGVS